VEAVSADNGRSPVDRLAAGFLILVLAAGSLMLWIGIPAGGLWAFSKLTDSSNQHFLLSLVFIPLAMALFAPALFWVNGLYMRVTGVLKPEEDEEGQHWHVRGPLELFLYMGMVVALVALFVWFFFFAENPPEIVW
jgi:hypothetical protein